MKDKKMFDQLLQEYHRKIITIFCIKLVQQLLGIVAIGLASIFIVSRFIVIVEWKALLIVASILSCILVGFKSYQRWPSKETTVKKYNESIEDDYVLTTYELDKNHSNYNYLLSKTEELMKQNHSAIMTRRIPLWDVKWISIFLVCLFISFTSYVFPSETQREAVKQNEINDLVKQTEESLEQLKQLTNDEEKKELMHLTIEKLGELQTTEEIVQEIEKLNAEVHLQLLKDFEKIELLQQAANSTTDNLSKVQDALKDKNLAQLKDALAQIDTTNLSSMEQKMVENIKQLELTEEDLKNLVEGKWDEKLTTELNDLGKKVEGIAKEIDPNRPINFQGNIAQGPSNQNPSGQTGQQAPDGANNGTENPSAPNGTQSGSNNPGANSGGTTGSMQGEPGTGSSGPGSTVGGGTSGIGTGQGNRDLTLPSRVVGEHSIEMDTGQLGDGQQGIIMEAQGLAVKGQIKDYEKVFNAYETINQNTVNRTPLPSNLSDLVKNYFSNME